MVTMYGKTARAIRNLSPRRFPDLRPKLAVVSKAICTNNFIDHGLTEEKAAQIDTSKIPVYLLTGEYDWGQSPIETRALAHHINGSKFFEMKGSGTSR